MGKHIKIVAPLGKKKQFALTGTNQVNDGVQAGLHLKDEIHAFFFYAKIEHQKLH